MGGKPRVDSLEAAELTARRLVDGYRNDCRALGSAQAEDALRWAIEYELRQAILAERGRR